jgi:hypothetical protein
MSRTTTLVALICSCACASAPPLPPPDPGRDWSRGLADAQSPNIAPLGPLESDQRGYDFIRQREHDHSLGSSAVIADLDDIIAHSSQLLASSLALPLVRAGVFLGQPLLIERGCVAGRRVTSSELRESGNVNAALEACAALSEPKSSVDACGEGQQKLRDAYALLAAEKPTEAGRAAAEAVRGLRDRCPRMSAPLRTPVQPSTKGFLIVWALHANDAPPVTWLAGERAPNTADAINDAFTRGVQALRPYTSHKS